jgi:hypothetical protein
LGAAIEPHVRSRAIDSEFRPTPAGRVALCRLLWQHVVDSQQTERLLLIEGWSVWPSGEHLPLFTRLREACGEGRSLADVPGHLFAMDDEEDGLSFLVVATLFLWDYLLCSGSGRAIMMSHDEYGAVVAPDDDAMLELRQGLERLHVLE